MNDVVSTTVDLIRHGEPVGGRKYRGQIDDPLSEKGWAQMRQAVADHNPWDVIISSTLRRCMDFAQELGERTGLDVRAESRLMEIGFGEWEGRTASELEQQDPGQVARFLRDPLNNTPPGAETLLEFETRIIGAWNDMLQQYAGKHVLLVGHAGMMRMIIRHVLDMPIDRMFRIQVANAAITRIRVEGNGANALLRLVFHDGKL
jgi:alpha-ribazole phosphatase/probable phosphoglycerate mutase